MRLLPLAIVILCVSVAPLTAATAKDILGTWGVDTDAMWEAAKKDIPAEQQELAKQFMLPMLAQMRFVVTADTVVTTAPGGKLETSTYVIDKIEGEAITMTSTSDGKIEKMTMTMAGGDRATLSNGAEPGKAIPIKRVPVDAAPAAPAVPVAPKPVPKP